MPPDDPGRLTVLLVEDDPDDRLMAQHAFERVAPGLRLMMSFDGEDAVAYLSGEGACSAQTGHPLPQVVLLDLKLPRKSGFEVLQWMREQPRLRDLPVFVLSSSQERGDIERAYALGANSYLVKQADIQAFRALVRGIEAYVTMVSGQMPSALA
jgi:CheY-like chemotaxis protein